ncbi:MAG: hypothetical protein DID91_2727704521 [Candidatus Nitrotoga sp. MKT]|nr:MAG: hypothetical protein DID91_2727704521 [Candidatus Nitrotoga sp. MKT]
MKRYSVISIRYDFILVIMKRAGFNFSKEIHIDGIVEKY